MTDYRNSVGESELFGRISGGFMKVMEGVENGRFGWDREGVVVCESEDVAGAPVEEAKKGGVSISVIRQIFFDDHRGDCDRDEEFVEDREFESAQEALDYVYDKYDVDKFDRWHGTAKSMINRFTMEQYEVIPHGFKFAEGEGGTLCVAVDEGFLGGVGGAGIGAMVGGVPGAIAGGAIGNYLTGKNNKFSNAVGTAGGAGIGALVGGPAGAAVGGAIGNVLTKENVEDGEGVDEGVVGSAVGAGIGACLGGVPGAVAGGALGQAVTGESEVCEDGEDGQDGQDGQPSGGQPDGETEGGSEGGQPEGQGQGGGEAVSQDQEDAAKSEAPQQVNGSVNECGGRERTGSYRKVRKGKVDEGIVKRSLASGVGTNIGMRVGDAVGRVAGDAICPGLGQIGSAVAGTALGGAAGAALGGDKGDTSGKIGGAIGSGIGSVIGGTAGIPGGAAGIVGGGMAGSAIGGEIGRHVGHGVAKVGRMFGIGKKKADEATSGNKPMKKLVPVEEAEGVYEDDFPAWALDYVVNGERGSVSAEERRAIEAWKRGVREEGYAPGKASFGEDEFFSRRPAFGEPCQCVTVTIPVA